MKEIKAIIQPHRLTPVIDALQAIAGLPGVTVSEVKGFGRNRAKGAKDKVVQDYLEYAKKVKLEIVVPDEMLDSVLESIITNARTDHAGDGLIFISTVDNVIRVRTGEHETYTRSGD